MNILLPTAYLPPVSYMIRCMMAGSFTIEAWETYPKQTIRNRCYIYSPNGRQCLTVPVTRPFGNHTRTRDIRICYQLPWQQVHWRSLETAYNKSPFFLYYRDDFYPLFHKTIPFLLDFNLEALEILNTVARLRVDWKVSSSYNLIMDGIEDLRQASNLSGEKITIQPYYQVFSDKHGFLQDLSFIDLLFNLGPETQVFLKSACYGV